MLRWRFRTYVTASGKQEVQADIDRFGDYGRERFMAQVRHLAGTTSKSDWHEPQAKKLTGVKDIYEIRFKDSRAQTRALGFFGPDDDTFTILIIATHKQNVYKPPNAIRTAEDRRKAVVAGQAGTAPLQIDGEDFPPIDEA